MRQVLPLANLTRTLARSLARARTLSLVWRVASCYLGKSATCLLRSTSFLSQKCLMRMNIEYSRNAHLELLRKLLAHSTRRIDGRRSACKRAGCYSASSQRRSCCRRCARRSSCICSAVSRAICRCCARTYGHKNVIASGYMFSHLPSQHCVCVCVCVCTYFRISIILRNMITFFSWKQKM